LNSASVPIEANTTFWLNTDQDTSTGFKIFGFAGGSEFMINVDLSGAPGIYTASDNPTFLGSTNYSYSADRRVLELSTPVSLLDGLPTGTADILVDVNDAFYLPTDFSAPSLRVKDVALSPPAPSDAPLRIAIVYSETTADAFFSKTAYSQLFMAAQNQAAMAGVPFDILTEADLSNLATLTKYDSIVFPAFSHVKSTMLDGITNTLLDAVHDYGVGLITAGNFMTNIETGASVAGDAYSRMKTLLGITLAQSDSAVHQIELKSAGTDNPIMAGLPAGSLIRTYDSPYGPIGTQIFQGLEGVSTTVLARQTVHDLDVNGNPNNQTFEGNAVLATVTGGRNVHFATEGMLADNNLLGRAIDWSVREANTPALRLEMSRHKAIFASRNDMDQSQEVLTVNPAGDAPGIYDVMMPILEKWKAEYDFVGSYYLNIGDDYNSSTSGDTNLSDGHGTDWAVSKTYYQKLLALGNEIGSHSYSHPSDTNDLTNQDLEREFRISKEVLEYQLGISIRGAAIPGMPEELQISQEVLKYYSYLSGGNSMIGAGYPGAFGYLTPDISKGVYLAPNISSDFTVRGWLNLSFEESIATWQREWQDAVKSADLPVVVFPWHDYGLTGWITDPGAPKAYGNEAMFTPLIKAAYDYGSEFVTLADLAQRIATFEKAELTTTYNALANSITATVGPGILGTFQLDLDTQNIASVDGWYAYDADSVFLPGSGGTFTINLGATKADVTHIFALPARGRLDNVQGDGRNLSFSLYGEGQVQIDLAPYDASTEAVRVSGAQISSLSDGILKLNLANIGQHNVTVSFGASDSTAPIPVITSVASNASRTTITGTSEAGSTVTVLDKGVVIGSAIATALGVWSLVLAPPLANVVHSLSADAVDAAGNVGTTSRLILLGSTAADSLAGGAGADSLSGGNGADTLDGGAGADTMLGGAGNDVYFVDDAGDTLVEQSGQGTDRVIASGSWTLAAEFEHLTLTGTAALAGTGNALANSITGNTGANTLVGGDGADTLDGVAGGDSLVGGTGNDIYLVDSVEDVILELPDGGLDEVRSAVTWTLGANIERLIMTGTATIDAIGNELANHLAGNTSANLLIGGLGGDTLVGGAGDDTLDGGTGADSMVGGAGNDTFIVDSAGDVVLESSGRDIVQSSIDYTLANGLEDLVLVATASRGTGNAVANRIVGSDGLGNLLSGLAGNDTLVGGAASDTLLAGLGADSLFGGAGADTLKGEDGNDVLLGGEGSDLLEGGPGRDSLTGGVGLDRFLFGAPGQGPDAVTDFISGEDMLLISATGFNLGLAAGMAMPAALLVNNTTGRAASAQGVGQFIFETDVQTLWWDADGGSTSGRVAIATLAGVPSLTTSNFTIIA
jgi:Ca2+-binding RTX toxin-like protein